MSAVCADEDHHMSLKMPKSLVNRPFECLFCQTADSEVRKKLFSTSQFQEFDKLNSFLDSAADCLLQPSDFFNCSDQRFSIHVKCTIKLISVFDSFSSLFVSLTIHVDGSV